MTTVAKFILLSRSGGRGRRGMAMVEAVSLIVIFVMLTGYMLGMWGAVHSGILRSIAARTYAFETFRNRTDLRIFRENTTGSEVLSLVNFGVRIHGINDKPRNDLASYPTPMPLAIGITPPQKTGSLSVHKQNIEANGATQNRRYSISVSPIWIMINYGICLDAQCGS